ncbi:glycerophosphodiester phosphodiesterase [candidate division KSB1 bacterium]|nr:MAG: glycerophosphodiester phosphodiesterase [candidate division KSB1 bacterium]RKY84085.1 MAG: glycerophosphodiester phosphodiesterase [candidate division KSB1 bacterium]
MKVSNKMKSTLIVAHRGMSSLYPENTLVSFKKALELGVDMIELDVHRTKDKELVVIHDNSVDRTTNGKGKVDQLTLQELKKYSAGSWFSQQFEEERIPTLGEVFELVNKKTKLQIEIKQSGIEDVLVNFVEKYDMVNNVVCSSFNLRSIIKVRKLNPLIPTLFIARSFNLNKMKKVLLTEGINMVAIEFRHLSLSLLKACHSCGFVVDAWTIDEERDMVKFLEMGVGLITTNYPQRLKKILGG